MDYIKYVKFGIGEFLSILKINKWLKIFNKKTKIYNLKTKFKKEIFYFRNENYVNEPLLKIWLLIFILMIPMIFFEFLLWKYHLKGLIIKKRRAFVILKMFFDNFRWYVKLNKIVGGFNSYHMRKMKYPRTYYHTILFRKRKKIKRGFFFRWDRFRNLYVKMAPLGSYYYWFEHINKKKAYMCYNKFFFHSVYKTKYYKFIICIYLVFIWFLYRKLKLDLVYTNIKKIKYIRILEIYNIMFRIK